MSELDAFLKAAKPVDNDARRPVKGTYSCVVKVLSVNEPDEFQELPYWRLNLQVTAVLDGEKSALNGFFNRRYPKNEAGIQRFLNDMTTAGIEVPRESISQLEASFDLLVDKVVLVRSWVGTMHLDEAGTVVNVQGMAEADKAKLATKEVQNWTVTSAKRNKKLVEKAQQVPF